MYYIVIEYCKKSLVITLKSLPFARLSCNFQSALEQVFHSFSLFWTWATFSQNFKPVLLIGHFLLGQPLNTDQCIIQAKASHKGRMSLVSILNRQLSKEPILYCIFMRFVTKCYVKT